MARKRPGEAPLPGKVPTLFTEVLAPEVNVAESRAEAVKLILKQLHDGSGREKAHQWHYGRQELRELMDFIYGQEPQSEAEMIPSWRSRKW